MCHYVHCGEFMFSRLLLQVCDGCTPCWSKCARTYSCTHTTHTHAHTHAHTTPRAVVECLPRAVGQMSTALAPTTANLSSFHQAEWDLPKTALTNARTFHRVLWAPSVWVARLKSALLVPRPLPRAPPNAGAVLLDASRAAPVWVRVCCARMAHMHPRAFRPRASIAWDLRTASCATLPLVAPWELL
jgi:hypothetical protein